MSIAVAAAAQFRIDWYTVDGGGGTSVGNAYSVTGTIGQRDAVQPSANGLYTVTGGFWAWPVLVQTPGAPLLLITNAVPGFATIGWIPALPDFELEESDSLSPAQWIPAPSGSTNPIQVPVTWPRKFYPLSKP